jgi:hypothetical protein
MNIFAEIKKRLSKERDPLILENSSSFEVNKKNIIQSNDD